MKPYIIDAKSIYDKESSYAFILGGAMLATIGNIENPNDNAIEKLDDWEKFAYLYFWFDHKIDGYGFLLLFNLNLSKYFPFIIHFLEKMEEEKSRSIFAEAYDIYLNNKIELDESIGKDPLYLFDKFQNLDKLSSQHNKVASKVMTKINKHVKANIATYFLDQEGNAIDPKFTGTIRSYYKNGGIKHEYEVKAGQISGLFNTFSLQGKLISHTDYGTLVENRHPYTRYYTNGNIAERSSINENGYTIISEQFTYDGLPIFSEKQVIGNPLDKISEQFWENGIIQSRIRVLPENIKIQYFDRAGMPISNENFDQLVYTEHNENYFGVEIALTPQYQHIAVANEQDIIDQVPICLNGKEVFWHKITRIPIENWQNRLYLDISVSKEGKLISLSLPQHAQSEQEKYFFDKISPYMHQLLFKPAIAYNNTIDYEGAAEFIFV